ncbi:NAD-dependent epimerase/dehydratase family protein [Streptomyces maremycinicus]|uniref:NAD-dependent epimerase/dehydratase family protein n=1 Tax=Streptomyces maremycinicus TaxID=1679753 RepID=UPI0007870A6F|nr:NAD-dependent epimerase/dehydratase family protein [Streptomyces sp. NBRC 110468]
MRILVLGGTSFVGRAIVECALAEGADVTLFSRGRTNPGLFPQATRRLGDRESGQYDSLKTDSHGDGDGWDAVVDVTGFVPRHITQAADVLGDRVGRYLFISSIMVYDTSETDDHDGVWDEDAPRLTPLRDTEDITLETYGPLKAACEDEVLARYGTRATLVRPGIIAGPYDPTDRFTWWVRRAARGSRIALPGQPEQPVQVVDVHDLAALVWQLLVDDRPGVFNAVGPALPTTMTGMVEACAQAAGTSVGIVPVPVPAASEPVLPLLELSAGGKRLFRLSGSRARRHGLPATPLATTAAKVLAWDRERGEPPLRQGLTEEQEAALLSLP